MKKLLGILVLGLLLNGCATTDSLVSKGKIKQGLTKSELQDALWTSYPDDDPFLPGGGSMLVHDNNAEIIWGESRNVYYVFRYVSETVSCGILLCRLGNGTLESWHKTLDEARASLPKKELTQTEKLNQMPSKTYKKSENKKGKNAMVASIKDIPGVADAGWPQDISLWIFMSNPNAGHDFDRLGYTVCNGAVTNFGVQKGYSITFWNPYNKKEIGKYRCY